MGVAACDRTSADAPAASRLSLPLPSDAPLAPNDSPSAGSSIAISQRWPVDGVRRGARR